MDDLLGGISFIPLMIGMFAVSEVLRFVVSNREGQLVLAQEKIGNVFKGQWTLIKRYPLAILRMLHYPLSSCRRCRRWRRS